MREPARARVVAPSICWSVCEIGSAAHATLLPPHLDSNSAQTGSYVTQTAGTLRRRLVESLSSACNQMSTTNAIDFAAHACSSLMTLRRRSERRVDCATLHIDGQRLGADVGHAPERSG